MSEFEKSQIVTFNDYGQSLRDIAKKMNHNNSSITVFLKDYKKTGNYLLKEDFDHNRKTIASEDRKILWAAKSLCTATWRQLKDK